MERILRTGKGDSNGLILETNSTSGRNAIEINLNNICDKDFERLEKFLADNGYNKTSANNVIEKIKANLLESGSHIRHFRLENLGLVKSKPEALPRVGQSHEIEIRSLRSRISMNDEMQHADEFLASSTKCNDITSIKIVSETLGKPAYEATTEFVLAPAATKDEYIGLVTAVLKFRNYVEHNSGFVAIEEAYKTTSDDKIEGEPRGEVWSDPKAAKALPCVHTTRGAPIRSLSDILLHPDSQLFDAPKIILEKAIRETHKFVEKMAIKTAPGKKLWETINLSIWMSACEGIIQPLLHGGIKKQYATNVTIQSWIRYAGKNFFGALPRFCAGDLIRSGGLRAFDIEQLENLFAHDDKEKVEVNIGIMVDASAGIAKEFIDYLGSSYIEEYMEIAEVLRTRWRSVVKWIVKDLKSDLIPGVNKDRYPDDKVGCYGDSIEKDSVSPSFASSQYVPRRERLFEDNDHGAPVLGALEFRQGQFLANDKIATLFSRDQKEENALDTAWDDFLVYVERLS